MLSAGSRVGPYEIVSRAGAGGMGEVWKARDTRLNRSIAIKISDKQFSDRFEREARAIAALNHPHIAALYDVGPDYLVMEYVDGEPIKGPLPLGKALEYGKQILEALHAAHRAGIVHRDLKPANILVTKAGVKVLDFGLAKMEQPAVAGTGDSATVMGAITQEGAIAGTLQYMAPEQLQGGAVDGRADLFAFGCVLYEMLTGKRAFDGASAASVIAAILERPAPSVGNVAPPGLDRVLKRCLAKDPEERWQDALDVKAELEWIGAGEEASAASAPRRQRKWPLLAAIGALAAALAAVCLVHFREKPAEAPLVRASINPPGNANLPPQRAAISQDGTRVAFISDSGAFQRIWVRPLDSASAYPIEGTEGALSPFWSPDGKSIGFIAGGKLKVADALGGAPIVIAERIGTFRGAAWMPDGTIVYGHDGRLRSIRSSGGSASDLTLKNGSTANVVSVCGPLPDGTRFLYITREGAGRYMLRAGSIASHESWPIEEIQSLAYYSSGHLLSWHGDNLIAQPFDPRRLRITGSAVSLGKGFFTASASYNGVLAYIDGTNVTLQLSVVDRHGTRLSDVSEPLPDIEGLDLSPDGSKVITRLSGSGGADLWIYDLARGVKTRLTDDGDSTNGIWSPDGKTIIYSSRRNGILQIFRKASNGAGGEKLLYQDSVINKNPMSWSRDGKFLLFLSGHLHNGTIPSLWILRDPLAPGEKKPFVFAQSNFTITGGQFSPDGKWVSYQSDESGRVEVYVAPFPGPGPIVPVSRGGGMFARWGPRGNELFYLDSSMRLISVPIRVRGSRLEVGAEQTLFEGIREGAGFPYDVMPDGNHFIIVRLQGKSVWPSLNIIQNWPAMLKRNS